MLRPPPAQLAAPTISIEDMKPSNPLMRHRGFSSPPSILALSSGASIGAKGALIPMLGYKREAATLARTCRPIACGFLQPILVRLQPYPQIVARTRARQPITGYQLAADSAGSRNRQLAYNLGGMLPSSSAYPRAELRRLVLVVCAPSRWYCLPACYAAGGGEHGLRAPLPEHELFEQNGLPELTHGSQLLLFGRVHRPSASPPRP